MDPDTTEALVAITGILTVGVLGALLLFVAPERMAPEVLFVIVPVIAALAGGIAMWQRKDD
jgi:hypothetical protein